MDFYRIVGSECGRDRYGDFECICGRCEKLPEGSTHDELAGHPARESTTHRKEADSLLKRVEELERKIVILKRMSDSSRRQMDIQFRFQLITSIGLVVACAAIAFLAAKIG